MTRVFPGSNDTTFKLDVTDDSGAKRFNPFTRELEQVYADGKTPDECVRETRFALTGVVARLMEKGQTPPAPAGEQARDQQINIRVSGAEKLLLEEAARSKGFRGVSDFVRSTTLERARDLTQK